MVGHEKIFDAFVTDAVLTGQDERMSEKLFTDGTDQLSLNALHGHLCNKTQADTQLLHLTLLILTHFKKKKNNRLRSH